MGRVSSGKTRIAWITFDFPPRQSSGVFRAIKIYKYLDKSRFEVDFITHGSARRFQSAVHDDTLLGEVHPTPAVYRVPTIILHDFLPALRARLRRVKPSRGQSPTNVAVRNEQSASARSGSDERAAADTPAPSPQSPASGLGRTLYGWFALSAYVPDHLFIWGWSAALKSVWLHLRHRYDVVYTTSFPESAHLPGLVLSALGVRWVVDYRYGGPLWIKDVVGFRKPPLRERLDHRYQRWVLTRADRVITQSERIRADFCQVFSLDPARVTVIPSGYDEADFTRTAASPAPFAKAPDEIHLLHMGTLEGAGPVERTEIAETIDALAASLSARGRRLVFHALGSDVMAAGAYRPAHVEYQHHGVVVHHDIPTYLLAADCYLLSTWTTSNGGVKGFIPSKLWEYLRAGAPILTTGPKDEVWSIVDDAGVGLHMPLGDARTSVDVLAEDLLARVQRKKAPAATVGRYTWQSRAESVQRVFQQLVDGAVPC
jgi:glycosyltransferase involved in cell wall biosynthesis